jgi:hypothetical protein
MDTHLAQGQRIESHIFVLRGHRVMLDADLAKLYGVTVKALNQAVKRNADRFPADFMFQLTWEEAESSRSQFVTLDVRLRDMIAHNRDLARRLDILESKYDRQFKVVFDAIRQMMAEPAPAPKRRIGFVSDR